MQRRACRTGGERTRPALLFLKLVFCERSSNTFAADPPGRLGFRRGCKGEKVKTMSVMTGRFHACVVTLIRRNAHWLLRPTHTARPETT